jgi:predicted DsbA family dithiol-disulfide isomerase
MKKDFPVEIDYKSFYLRPDMPSEGVTRKPRDGSEPGALLEGRMGEAAVEAGLIMRRAPVTPNTRMSFEASEFAKEKGLFEEFHNACYRALWEDGVNLGEESALQRIGEGVGLDALEMKECLDEGRYTAQVETQYKEALGMGVQGIPSFIMGQYFFSGAQPYEFFVQLARRVQEDAVALGSQG